MEADRIRQYITVNATNKTKNAAFVAAYKEDKPDAVVKQIAQDLEVLEADNPVGRSVAAAFRSGEIKVVRRPSFAWKLERRGASHGMAPPAVQQGRPLIVVLELPRDLAEPLRSLVALAPKLLGFRGPWADLAFGLADHWCPGAGGQYQFATRGFAEARMRIDALRRAELTGENVNVVVVDQGIDKDRVPNVIDRWIDQGNPPQGSRPEHGTRVALNILSIAPKARLFDLPLIPGSIGDVNTFVSDAQAAFEQVLSDIPGLAGPYPGSWIMVNAWAIFDRRRETPLGDYTASPDHDFNRVVRLCEADRIDLIFAAGNCGTFCPDRRCAGADTGPGRSIMGAHSLPEVLTVGGVRADGMWAGFSSQGRGLIGDEQKPDFCAPTQFRDDDNAHVANTGTSTSCALTAGVVAALRGKWPSDRVPPSRLREVLRDKASRPTGSGWNNRTGFGILDAEATMDELP